MAFPRPARAIPTALLAAALAPTHVGAQTLTMGLGSPVSSLDPHYHQLRSNNEVASMLFDALVLTDDRARLQPGLAESWRTVGEDVWEFRLRPGVRFHNGSSFEAEDVAYTLRRIPQVTGPGASFSTHVRPVRSVEVVDAHTIRLRTDGPYPLLPVYFSQVAMVDRQTHEGASTEDFNNGKAAIGTGAFRLVAHRPGDRIIFERNTAYWGPQPPWSRVEYRLITNDAARSAALLAGDVDFIDQIPTSDIARLRQDRRLRVVETTSLRSMYLTLDSTRGAEIPGVSGADGQALERNPLADPQVRRALSLAIDRNALVERVMEGAAIATGQFLPPGMTTHVPDLPTPAADPEAARRLLAEASYPRGFRITLAGSNDRYMNDARVVQAIGQMWTRIGIRTTVEAAPYASFITRASRREVPVALLSWGNSTGEASVVLNSVLGTVDRDRGRGAANRVHYSNPALDRALSAAEREMADDRREALLQQATRLAMEDVALIPLYIQNAIWAMRADLTYEPRVDERNAPGMIRPVGDRR
jgi:peptide/nickel transport system substrate-binding protein